MLLQQKPAWTFSMKDSFYRYLPGEVSTRQIERAEH